MREPPGAPDVAPIQSAEQADTAAKGTDTSGETGDAKGLWETFRPIASLEEANQLLRAALFAGVILVGQIALDLIDLIIMDASGRRIDPMLSNGEVISGTFMIDMVVAALIAASVWGVMRKRSQVAAIGLLILCGLNLAAFLVTLSESAGWLRLGTVILNATAIFLAVQAYRAIAAHRRMAHEQVNATA